MALSIDPAKVRLIQTVPNDKVGFWSGAVDTVGQRLFVGGTDFQVHVYDLPAVQPAKVGPLKGHQSYVSALVYLPQAQILISGAFDKELAWWKPGVQATPVRKIDAGGRVNRLAVAPDGSFFASATDDLVVRLWDLGGKVLKEFKGGHPLRTHYGRDNTLYSVAFSPDGKRLATGDRAGTICLWDVGTGKLVRSCSASVFYSYATLLGGSQYEWGGIRALAFSPDGALLVAGGMGPADQNSAGIDGPMRLEVFDPATGKSVAAFDTPGFKGMLNSMAFHPGGRWLVAAGGGGNAGSAGVGSICLWDHQQRDKAGKLTPPTMLKSAVVIREVLFSPDGGRLFLLGMLRDVTAGRIEVWDLTGSAPTPTPAKTPAKKV